MIMGVYSEFKGLKAIAFVLISLIQDNTAQVAIEDFFPFGIGNGDLIAQTGDDGFTPVTLGHNLIFFNSTYDRLFVNINGGLSFGEGVTQFTPKCGPLLIPMIVPFWSDINTALGGNIFYRESTDRNLLRKAESELQKAFSDFWKISPSLGWLFIVTWSNVPFYGAGSNCEGLSKRNTFQLIIASDGIHSFALFYYNNIEWTTGTASGGNCNGLDGTAAKAGFDFGDNKTFYEIGSSCTPNVIDIETTSNVNDPGKWIFRIDNSVESAKCDAKENFNLKRLTIKPAFVRLFGHVPITLTGPCLTNITQVFCKFHDHGQLYPIEVNGKFEEETSASVCEVPFLYGYGRIKVELIVQNNNQDANETYFGYLYSLDLEDDTSITLTSVPEDDEEIEIEIKWNPDYFDSLGKTSSARKKRGISTTKSTKDLLKLSMYEYKHDVGWKNKKGMAFKNISNTGSAKRRIKRKKFFDADSKTGKIISYSVRFQDIPIIIYEEIMPVIDGFKTSIKETFTPLLCLNTILPFQDNIKACHEWYLNDPGPPSDILPCPPTLRQIQEDGRYQLDDGLTGETLEFFHPGAEIAYRQRIPSRSNGGQQCVYKRGSLLLGPPGGGTADRVSPNKDKYKHWYMDVLPWCQCCAHSNDKASCRKYYEKRPSDPGNRYAPQRPARAAGDPHITTLDSVSYTFNGVGEFWMIKTEDGSFSMQARMEQFRTDSGKLTNASIFTAFAMQENSNENIDPTIVQVLVKSSGIVLIIDDEVINFEEFDADESSKFLKTNSKIVIINGISVTQEDSEVMVSFSRGFSFIFSTSDNKSLNIIGFADESLINVKMQGLLGNFDKNPENDLVSPDGTIISPSSDLEFIHYNFGLKWMITEIESLFSYADGESHSTFKLEGFVPNFNVLSTSDLPTEVADICGTSQDCLFDYITTGSVAFANNTKSTVEQYEAVVEVSKIVIKMCTPILNFENGYFNTTNFLLGSEAQFYCNEGYELVGMERLICESQQWNGMEVEWSHEIPYCSEAPDRLIFMVLIIVLVSVISLSLLIGVYYIYSKRTVRVYSIVLGSENRS